MLTGLKNFLKTLALLLVLLNATGAFALSNKSQNISTQEINQPSVRNEATIHLPEQAEIKGIIPAISFLSEDHLPTLQFFKCGKKISVLGSGNNLITFPDNGYYKCKFSEVREFTTPAFYIVFRQLLI